MRFPPRPPVSSLVVGRSQSCVPPARAPSWCTVDRVRLVRFRACAYGGEPMNASNSQPPPARVLVVDDNAQNRALVEATLADDGYTVLSAVSGQQGIDVFAAEAPDCILLDVRMPGLDGFAVCERIRA